MAEWREEDHPRDELGRFTDKYGFRRANTPYFSLKDTIPLPDEQLPHSVGAKWANYDIELPDGSFAHFVEGSVLRKKEIIAGYKCRRKIDDIRRLIRENKITSTTSRLWVKAKAIGDIVLPDGMQIEAELHWYEHPKVGKIEFKLKDEEDDC